MSSSTQARTTPGHDGPSEREAREVAEAARESGWSRPSFAKGLYLGRFDIDLVHPHPRPDPEDEARGEAFLARLRAVCEGIDGAVIERDAKVPDEVVRALADVGAFGMKIPVAYGGLGLSMRVYGKALTPTEVTQLASAS